ncbi:hypothetical protein JTB14_033972 [Gonioctena quinquepunctata]|nr:hypothetical protein JTB14_033972 [Gonioctena quinquepunctata]
MDLEVLPLHKHPEHLSDCCNLLNEEWKRSDTARLHSLRSSCDNLPTSLILLKQKKLIGHLKLSVIPSMKNSCFLESVVIDGKFRGKGYGSVLMKEAEKFCKQTLGLDTLYLSTKGQEQFYTKLGYSECMPVSIYGNYVPRTIAPQHVVENDSEKCIVGNGNAPPPPPLPESKTINCTKTFMGKIL